MLTTIDKFGRVKIPKKILKHLGIHSGTTLNISENGKRIVIEPVQEKEPLVEKNGILVFTGKLNGKINGLIQKDRKTRIKSSERKLRNYHNGKLKEP